MMTSVDHGKQDRSFAVERSMKPTTVVDMMLDVDVLLVLHRSRIRDDLTVCGEDDGLKIRAMAVQTFTHQIM
jgi:hypothetical protein